MSDCSCSSCETTKNSRTSSKINDEIQNHELRNRGITIGIGLILSVAGYLFQSTSHHSLSIALYVAALVISGYDIFLKAAKGLIAFKPLNENFLMSVASIGAFLIGQYPEGIAVMLFYQIGETFREQAVAKSRTSISALMDIRPDTAHLMATPQEVSADISLTTSENLSQFDTTSPECIAVGSLILVRPGERIPLDGRIIFGTSPVDTSMLTGESLPRTIAPGDEVMSGFVNGSNAIKILTTSTYDDSAVAKILELVENAGDNKSTSEQFITRFARYYTPAVVAAALVLGIVIPLILKIAGVPVSFDDWIYRALVFLVISCPCALVISVPLTFFGGIGGASRNGVLIKGGRSLEALAKADTIVFDKTGTLTTGSLSVVSVVPYENRASRSLDAEGPYYTRQEILRFAALAEAHSNHPVAKSIRDAAQSENLLEGESNAYRITDVTELAGLGIEARVNENVIRVGNAHLVKQALGCATELFDAFGDSALSPGQSAHFVLINSKPAGWIIVSDTLREDARKAIASLHELGIRKIHMLSGDMKSVADEVGRALGIDSVHSELLPEDKVSITEELMAREENRGNLVFIGDGINDAPVIARADIGIAMGHLGSDAAIEAADIVLTDDRLTNIPLSIILAKKTVRIASENIILALSIKSMILVLGAFGYASMWAAVFADVGVSVLAIFNALRALKKLSL
ncbi:MAG: heavy metal translocating P-type ATPase [Coriobacteriia bacterium]|nr:heavy metal translocating P-type ATPase [Coriobacteriia bacterium]